MLTSNNSKTIVQQLYLYCSSMSQAEIGRGSFAIVCAHSLSNTAIKKISIQNKRSYSFLLNQISILSLCKHPNIVSYHSCKYDQNDKIGYIQMEHLNRTLEHVQFNRNWTLLQELTIGICSALDYLHSRGIIHRDVKLSNLMLDTNGVVKLIDFGVSTWKWLLPYESNNVIGSPCYMAPEIFQQRQYDEKVDIYALGVCLYQLIHGCSPYKGVTKDQYWKSTMNRSIEFAEHCEPRFKRLIKKMLKKDARERLAAREVISYLQEKSAERNQ